MTRSSPLGVRGASLSAAAIFCGLTMVAGRAAEARSVEPLTTIECPNDGQLGSLPSRRITRLKWVRTPAGTPLSYYYVNNSAYHIGTFAPRGWHCLSTYGSSGSSLLITPELHTFSELDADTFNLAGPAVALTITDGGTSGRFYVAETAARLFPTAASPGQRVASERRKGKNFLSARLSNDRIVARSGSTVRFVTPAQRDGLGTSFFLARGDLPIYGVAIFRSRGATLSEKYSSLVILNVRLSSVDARETSFLEDAVTRDYSKK